MKPLVEELKRASAFTESQLKEVVGLVERENGFLAAHSEEIEGCRGGLVSALECVLTTVKVLKDCNGSVQNGSEFIGMVGKVHELSQALKSLPGPHTEIGAGYVCNFLRKEAAKAKESFKVRLKNLLRQNVQIDTECVRVLKGLGGLDDDDDEVGGQRQEVTMTSIWGAIADSFRDEPEFCQTCVEEMVKGLWEVVVVPLLNHKAVPLSSSEQVSNHSAMWSLSKELGGAALSDAESYSMKEAAVYGSKLEVLGALMVFLESHVFPPSSSFSVWGPAFSLLVTESTLVPRLELEMVHVVTSQVLVGRYNPQSGFAADLRGKCEEFDSSLLSLSRSSGSESSAGKGVGVGVGDGPRLCEVWKRLPETVMGYTKQVALDSLRHVRGLSGTGAGTVRCSDEGLLGDYSELEAGNKLASLLPFSFPRHSLAASATGGAGGVARVPVGAWEVSVGAANSAMLLMAVVTGTVAVMSVFEGSASSQGPAAGLDRVVEDFSRMHLSLSKASSMAVQSPRQAALLSNDHRYLARACLQVSTMLSTSTFTDTGTAAGMVALGAGGEAALRAVSIQAAKCSVWLQEEAKAVLAEQKQEQAVTIRRLMRRVRLSVDNETAPLDALSPAGPNTASSTTTAGGSGAEISTTSNSGGSGSAHLFPRPSSLAASQEATPSRGGISAGVYGLAQSLGALESPAPAPAPFHSSDASSTPVSASSTGELASVSGLGIRRGLVGLLRKFEHTLDEDEDEDDDGEGVLNDATAARAIGRHLLLVNKQWRGVLAPSILASAIGTLAEGMVQSFVGTVLSSACIGEASIEGLVSVLVALQEAEEGLAKGCFQPALEAEQSSLQDRERDLRKSGDAKAVASFVPSWPKLAALVRFLECPSLSAVAEDLSMRHFAAFSSAEVSALVCSVFEDSQKRAAVLNNIHELVT
jgi:hypothetical protein